MAYVDGPAPIALAHRGGGLLAPENTMLAFATSVALGYRYLETDVRATADGELVCFHDRTLDRATDGTGPIGDRTLAQLRTVSVDGEPIATLEEALHEFDQACFSVDLKCREALAPLIRMLAGRPHFAERVCVAGAWDGWLREVREAVPGVATALGWRALTSLVTASHVGAAVPWWVRGAPFAHVPVRLGGIAVLSPRLVEIAHELGIRVVTWTVDEADEIRRVLAAGVDAVVTDRPDILREVLISTGDWPAMRVNDVLQ
ncbi:MAG: glycerophosphodiester phosphodiesterase family protein [Dermatophilus congolensis]|nr:glycerophosphodiester phosphodiesterase family protein [Dermatophilus congolensis]